MAESSTHPGVDARTVSPVGYDHVGEYGVSMSQLHATKLMYIYGPVTASRQMVSVLADSSGLFMLESDHSWFYRGSTRELDGVQWLFFKYSRHFQTANNITFADGRLHVNVSLVVFNWFAYQDEQDVYNEVHECLGHAQHDHVPLAVAIDVSPPQYAPYPLQEELDARPRLAEIHRQRYLPPSYFEVDIMTRQLDLMCPVEMVRFDQPEMTIKAVQRMIWQMEAVLA